MSARPTKPRFYRYRDEVREQVEAGDSFSEVEEVIDLADLDQEEKDALWLMAFSMRDSGRVPALAER